MSTWVTLALVSIQVGIQPFLMEKYVPRDGIKSSLVIIQETIKAICCLVGLAVSGNLSNIFSSWTLSNSLRVACIPATIYCVQDLLKYYAYLHLDPLAFNLINQSKIIFAAIFLRLILNRTPSNRQLIAFFILWLSSVMLTLDITSSDNISRTTTEAESSEIYGLFAIVIASISSGLGMSI